MKGRAFASPVAKVTELKIDQKPGMFSRMLPLRIGTPWTIIAIDKIRSNFIQEEIPCLPPS